MATISLFLSKMITKLGRTLRTKPKKLRTQHKILTLYENNNKHLTMNKQQHNHYRHSLRMDSSQGHRLTLYPIETPINTFTNSSGKSVCRGQKIHLSTRNYEWTLERTSNSSQSTGPVGRVLWEELFEEFILHITSLGSLLHTLLKDKCMCLQDAWKLWVTRPAGQVQYWFFFSPEQGVL